MSEKSKNSVTIETSIDHKQMYEFMMTHNYKSIMGILGLVMSAMAVVALIVYGKQFKPTMFFMMIVIALLFTVINPISMYFKAKQQVKRNGSFKHPLIYSLSEFGMEVSQNQEHLHVDWNEIIKVRSTKNLVVIYLSPVRAFIFPKSQIGEDFETFREIITANVTEGKVCVK